MTEVLRVSASLIPPLLTPLHPDGNVDKRCLHGLVEYVLAGGVTGVFVLGSSGEGPLLTASQRRTVVQTTAAAIQERVPLYVGVSDCSVSRTLEVIGELDLPGVTAFVATIPFYGSMHDPNVQVAYFEALADAAPRPLMLYNIPEMVHAYLEPPIVAQLAAHPNIIGIKDSSGDMARFQALLERKRPDFKVFQGAEQLAGLSLLAGADGIIAGMANLVPNWFAELVEAARRGEMERARELQAKINDLWTLHTTGYWLSCLKTAASLLGLCDPALSAPLPQLSNEATARVRIVLEHHHLLQSAAEDLELRGGD